MKILVQNGDITKYSGDCIVNAANRTLLGGGGVDGAIHRVAGPQLLAECRTLGGCVVGSAKITDAYGLKVKKIIHTVGPVWQGGNKGEKELLASCYSSALQLCKVHNLTSIAFPNISCGAYGFPFQEASKIALDTVQLWLQSNDHQIEEIVFMCFNKNIYQYFQSMVDKNVV